MASVFTTVEFTMHPSESYPSVVYFTEDVPGSNATRLVAAVVWRAATSPRRWHWRDPLRRIRHYFGPLGIYLHRKRNFQPWTGSAGMDGEQETLFNPERRVVRVLGREYPLPEGARTLVLLIDELAGARGEPRVIKRTLDLPTMPRRPPEISREPRSQDDGWDEGSLGESSAWAMLLQQDPEVWAFMVGE